MVGNITNIREMNEQEITISEIVKFQDNTFAMLLDDLNYFQEQLDLIPIQGNIRVEFDWLDDCEEYKGFYNVTLNILHSDCTEVQTLETMFPSFRLSFEIITNQFLCIDNKGKDLQTQMINDNGNTIDEVLSDEFTGSIIIIFSKKTK